MQSREEGKDQESIQSSTITGMENHGKVAQIQENTTHKRVKRSAFSQQVITRLQRTDKTA